MFVYTSIHAEDDLLETSFDLTDKKGVLAAKMKIVLRISGSADNIEEFMKKVDDDVGLMSSLPRNLSTLGQILQLTKGIIDKISQVGSLNLIIVNGLIEVIRHTRYSMHRGPLFPVFIR
jgi:hypothetical protein